MKLKAVIKFFLPERLKNCDYYFFLSKNIDLIKKAGVDEIFLYSDVDFRSKFNFGLSFISSSENLKSVLDGDFIFLDGTKFFDFNLPYLIKFHYSKNSLITIPLRISYEENENNLLINEDYTLTKVSSRRDGFVDTGFAIYNYNFRDKIGADDLFIELDGAYGVPFAGKFFNLNLCYSQVDIDHLNNMILENEKADKIKVVFLDRDGTINEDTGYVYKIDDLKFKNGLFEFLDLLQKYFSGFIIITNQAGVAKGKFKEDDYYNFESYLEYLLINRGYKILASYHCPYHQDGVVDKYKKDSIDRKPYPGLILRAAEKFNIDLFNSVMVGDKESDRIMLPYLKSYILKGNYEVKNQEGVYNSFDEIAKSILKDLNEKIS